LEKIVPVVERTEQLQFWEYYLGQCNLSHYMEPPRSKIPRQFLFFYAWVELLLAENNTGLAG